MSKISIFKLVSVAEETGLGFALSETLKTGFVTSRPIYYICQERVESPLPINSSI